MGKKADGKPRSRLTSYMFFVRICREEHEKQHPGVKLDFKEFFRKCSEKWKDMVPTEKKLFEEMAQRDKIRYENEMANYVPPPGEIKRKRKQIKDPNAPKRCLSAFFIFCKDHRAKLIEEKPELKVSEVATLLGKMWKLSTHEVKKSYEERAAQDRKRYEKEMIIFRSQQVNVEASKDIPVQKTEVEEQFQPKAKVAKLKPEKMVKPHTPMAVSVKPPPSRSQSQIVKPPIKNTKIPEKQTKTAKVAQMAAQAAQLVARSKPRVVAESDDESEKEDAEEEGLGSEEGEEESEEGEEEGSSEGGEEGSVEEEEEEEEAVVGRAKGNVQSKNNKNNCDNNEDDDEEEDDDDDDSEDDDDEQEGEDGNNNNNNNDAGTDDDEDDEDDDDDEEDDDDDE